MRIRTFFFASSLCLSAVLGSPVPFGTSPSPALAGGKVSDAAPPVALLATQPGALHTSLYLARAGDGAASPPVATFTHLPGAVVRGSVLPGTTVVLATADTEETRDLSFNASLFRLSPQAPPETLCNAVVHASRPLVTREGRVFVSRGVAGPEPKSARLADMRVDVLSIDEVDPATGFVRTIHTMSGYLAFLAGAFESEVIVYRVSPAGADIAGVDPDTGAVRVIVPSLPPFARDFSIDAEAGTLVFQGRHEKDHHTWTIESLDLISGKQSRLHESAGMNLAPHAWPGGAVAYNPEGGRGLDILGGASVSVPASNAPVLESAGEGVDWVLADSADRQWLAALHTVAGALPLPFALETATGKRLSLHGPPGARIAIAGFVPAAGGAQ